MNNPKNDLISIIVVTLNEGKRLPKLIESIFNQDYKNVELIINDSKKTTDNTVEVLNEWKNKISITYLQKNTILGEGRLEGAKVAKGKYLLHLDADMNLESGVLSEAKQKIDDGISAIYIPEHVIGEGYWTRCKWIEKECYNGDNDVPSPRFFLTDHYFKVGGHNPKLALSEDKDVDIKFKKSKFKMDWIKAGILHDEGRITPIKTFKSKFFWSQTGFEFLEAQKTAAWKQVLFIFIRPAYIRNWKLLLSRPHLTFGMYILKFMELSGAAIGGIGTKLGLLKKTNYKTTEK